MQSPQTILYWNADDAGSVLYGGAIDNCKLTHGLDSHSSGKVFDMIVHNNNTTTQLQTFPLTQSKYAHVKTIFQTVVSIMFHAQPFLQLSLFLPPPCNGAASA